MKFKLKEYHRSISDEELLDDVKRVATIIGKKTLTRAEYSHHGKYGSNTFLRRFKSWNTVLELCGLDVNVFQRAGAQGGHNYSTLTDEQLIEDLKKVANVLGSSTFSSGDYQKYGEFSRGTFFRRFGTWNNALEKAGLIPQKQVSGRRISDEAILQEIERVWIKLGRQPTATDIKSGISVYSLNTYVRHFESWRNALRTFVKYINGKEDSSQEEPLFDEKLASNRINYPELPSKHKTAREPNLRLRFMVMQRDNFKCCKCGASPAKDPSVELHIDHIKPWSKGGETVMGNLQTLCSKCNLGKSDIL
ncbi:MAG: HNH endonuclease [Clostridia bacterium]|nr:HNH endonuclease [Clostridia bacterium]